MRANLFRRFFAPVVRKAALAGIVGRERDRLRSEKGRFTRSEVEDIVASSWQGYHRLVTELPSGPSPFGNRLLLHLSCLTLSCYEVLVDRGIEQKHARELIGDTAWVIYRQWGKVPYALARWRYRSPRKRLDLCIRLFLRFPFSPPGYKFEDLPGEEEVALDMYRCQVADFFQRNKAPDLCRATWCNLDFALAEMWGGRLERNETLAEGCRRCDFRFQVKARGVQS